MSTPKTVKMKLNRNFTVRSTLGHMLTFTKGVPMNIPVSMERICAGVGAERVDGKDTFEEVEVTASSQPVDPGHRLSDIDVAIKALTAQNDVDDFTAAGTPKVKAVSDEVGYKVDGTEVIKAWKQYKADLLEAED